MTLVYDQAKSYPLHCTYIRPSHTLRIESKDLGAASVFKSYAKGISILGGFDSDISRGEPHAYLRRGLSRFE